MHFTVVRVHFLVVGVLVLLVECSQGWLGLSALSASSVRDVMLVLMRKGETTEVEAGGCAR